MVKDHEINQQVAMILLSGERFLVEPAQNEREAVDMIRQRLLENPEADQWPYDAVLMDIQMPVNLI